MVSNINLLELFHNQPELDHEMIMVKYISLVCKLLFNESSVLYTKEDIEKYLSDVFLEVFNYKYRIDSQNDFNKVLSEIVLKRKFMDMYRRKNNNILKDDVSVNLHIILDDVVRSILLKEGNSQLTDTMKSLDGSDSKMIARKYSLNQRLRDISNNSGLKVSTYA